MKAVRKKNFFSGVGDICDKKMIPVSKKFLKLISDRNNQEFPLNSVMVSTVIF